jgi:hypothetical protein
VHSDEPHQGEEFAKVGTLANAAGSLVVETAWHQIENEKRACTVALDQVLTGCVEKWRREVVLLPPVTEAEIHRIWSGCGSRAAKDVICLYTTVGGFANYEFEPDFYWSLWPLDLIRDENTERKGQGVMFCDHSIQVVNWAVRFEDDLRSSVWNVGQFGVESAEMTAPSLEMFFRIYLETPWLLLDAWNPLRGEACKK